MQPKDVTLYGRDYSAREFSDAELRAYMKQNPGEVPVSFLGRYIGYPKNKKCMSFYAGMYQHHLEAGRPTFFFHQIGYGDMEGGYAAGRLHAQTAKADAESGAVGWRGESPIVACMDRFYAKQGYRTLGPADLREYMRGFRSVLGDLSGFYGFYDSMRHAIDEDWASFYVQCGARSAHVPGIHAWQENNRQPTIFGTATDILELYANPSTVFGIRAPSGGGGAPAPAFWTGDDMQDYTFPATKDAREDHIPEHIFVSPNGQYDLIISTTTKQTGPDVTESTWIGQNFLFGASLPKGSKNDKGEDISGQPSGLGDVLPKSDYPARGRVITNAPLVLKLPKGTAQVGFMYSSHVPIRVAVRARP